MDRWDVIIIAGAAYVAIMTLVRLMVARRNQLVDQVRQQIDEQVAQQKKGNSAASDTDREAA